MKRSAPSATVVGLFVIGSVFVFLGTIAVLGGGFLFSNAFRAVVFFDGSVKGLRIGAPVTFRGVTIGEVKKINLNYQESDEDFHIAVYFDINPEALGNHKTRYRELKGKQTPRVFAMLLEKGLRARLEMESFVTGMLFINLDFFPDTPARYANLDASVVEVPSTPSRLEQVGKTLENLPLEEILNEVRDTLAAVKVAVSNDKLDTLLADGVVAVEAFSQAVQKTEQLVASINEKVPLITEDTRATFADIQHSVEQSRALLKSVTGLLNDNSPLFREIEDLVKEWERSARSIQRLADTVEANPEVLLRGKRRN